MGPAAGIDAGEGTHPPGELGAANTKATMAALGVAFLGGVLEFHDPVAVSVAVVRSACDRAWVTSVPRTGHCLSLCVRLCPPAPAKCAQHLTSSRRLSRNLASDPHRSLGAASACARGASSCPQPRHHSRQRDSAISDPRRTIASSAGRHDPGCGTPRGSRTVLHAARSFRPRLLLRLRDQISCLCLLVPGRRDSTPTLQCC